MTYYRIKSKSAVTYVNSLDTAQMIARETDGEMEQLSPLHSFIHSLKKRWIVFYTQALLWIIVLITMGFTTSTSTLFNNVLAAEIIIISSAIGLLNMYLDVKKMRK